MLKYQSTPLRPTGSSPHIDSLLLMTQLTANTAKKAGFPSEKDQIDSIRSLGRILLEEEAESTVTFDERGRGGTSQKTVGGVQERKMDIYERGQLSERKKFQRIINAHRAQERKIIELSNTTAKTLNASNTFSGKSRGSEVNLQPRAKQSIMLKELLKKCIKEESQIKTIKQKEKRLTGSKTNPYLNLTNRHTQPYPNKNAKRTATKQELQMIFEEVNQRSVELKKRKQATVNSLLTQRYQKEMQGVTFHPQLQSSKSLRESCKKGFLLRLKEDHRSRQRQKLQILTQQLRKDSFEPKLNTHSLSKSKINSFRQADSLYLTGRVKPEVIFEKNLSRFIYPQEEQYMGESKVNQTNQSMEIPLKASQLRFLFQ